MLDRKYMNAGARFYNGIRFNNPDPLSEIERSVSPYAYCANNPVKYFDPKGKEKLIAYNTKDSRNRTLIPAATKYRDDHSIHVFAHGNSGEIQVYMDNGSAAVPRGIKITTPEDFEAFLNEYSQTWQSRSAGQHITVVLHSCETGQERNGQSSIARKISNKLKNVTVIAPDEKLAVNRGYELGPFRTPDKPNLTIKDLKTPGNWRYYENGMNTRRLYNTPSPPKNFGQDPYQPSFSPSFYSFPSFSLPTVTIEIPYIEHEFLP